MNYSRAASQAQTLGASNNGAATAVTDSTSRLTDRGDYTDTKLLQMQNRHTLIADIGDAATGAQIATAVNGIIEVLIDVGIMKAE